ncbi:MULTISPECIES: winged helix-turn-helix domain-containing protein [Streptomyces]|nr:helix-turn-helix domain-containing protein [Streptomyces griseus]
MSLVAKRCAPEKGIGGRMLRIHFTAQDLARVVLAHNDALPVSEAVMSLQVLRRGSGLLLPGWRRHVLDHLPAQASLLGCLVPASGWIPDFLTPSNHASPAGGAFEVIRATPRSRLGPELRHLSHRRLPPWVGQLADGDRETLNAVSDALAAYYDIAVTPVADRMRTILDADRVQRVHTMARAGVGAVLAGLHPQVRWREPVLELPGRGEVDFHLEGRGLLLCAHVFCGPQPRALLNNVDTPVLVYSPVRSLQIGELAAERSSDTKCSPAALEALLGRTRAAVLHALADPAGHTTKQLALRLGISPASASEHASALRAVGLVTSLRYANTVRHTVTRLGTSLLVTGNAKTAAAAPTNEPPAPARHGISQQDR